MYPHLKLKETTSQIKRLTYLSIQTIVGDDLSRVAKIVVKMPYHNFEKLTAQFQEKKYQDTVSNYKHCNNKSLCKIINEKVSAEPKKHYRTHPLKVKKVLRQVIRS